MSLEECSEIVNRFKRRFSRINSGDSGKDLESRINSGWCYCLAFALKLEMSKYDNQCDIVRSYSHWFFRIKHNGVWVYFDAYTPDGTEELTDITDNTPNALEVWTLDEIITHLNAERVSMFVNLID